MEEDQKRFVFFTAAAFVFFASIAGGRSSAGEIFQVQEMSDSDEDNGDGFVEPVRATKPSLSSSSSPTADVTAASAAVMNAGHQRASLELRNLALEREASAVLSRADKIPDTHSRNRRAIRKQKYSFHHV